MYKEFGLFFFKKELSTETEFGKAIDHYAVSMKKDYMYNDYILLTYEYDSSHFLVKY